MAVKLSVPSILGINFENAPPGLVLYLQAIQDSLNIVDNSVVYKDFVNVNVPAPRLRATTAQGQAFTITGVNVASGADYANLVRDFQLLLQEHIALRQTVDDLVRELRGE